MFYVAVGIILFRSIANMNIHYAYDNIITSIDGMVREDITIEGN